MNARLLFAVTVLSFVSPAVAAGQGTGIRVSIQGAIGSHIGDGGDAQSLSLGVSFGEHFGVVVNAERSYVPTDVTFFEGGYSTSRGATTRFISGEFRYVPVTYKRISPYVIAGVGRGVSPAPLNGGRLPPGARWGAAENHPEGRPGGNARRSQRQQEVAGHWRPFRPNADGCGGSSATESASLLDSSLGPYLLLFSMEMPNGRSSLGRRPALSR
jgi:hypothetical protein